MRQSQGALVHCVQDTGSMESHSMCVAGTQANTSQPTRNPRTQPPPFPTQHRCNMLLSTAAACDDQGNAWMWGAAARSNNCNAHRVVSEAWLKTVQGQRVVFAGDSSVRMLYTSFTYLVHGSGMGDVFAVLLTVCTIPIACVYSGVCTMCILWYVSPPTHRCTSPRSKAHRCRRTSGTWGACCLSLGTIPLQPDTPLAAMVGW